MALAVLAQQTRVLQATAPEARHDLRVDARGAPAVHFHGIEELAELGADDEARVDLVQLLEREQDRRDLPGAKCARPGLGGGEVRLEVGEHEPQLVLDAVEVEPGERRCRGEGERHLTRDVEGVVVAALLRDPCEGDDPLYD